jgi:hypothetical protein
VPAEALFLEHREPSGEGATPEVFPRADGTVSGTGHCQIEAGADFQVCGAYPPGQEQCETLRAEHPHEGAVLERIRAVPQPRTDPVFGAGGPLVRVLTSKWVVHPKLNDRILKSCAAAGSG